MLPKPPSEGQIHEFLEHNGALGKRLADLIVKIAPEVREIIETGIGWQLLKDDVHRFEALAIKVLGNKEVTESEREECKYLMFERIPKAASKITIWYKAMGIMSVKKKQQ